MKLKITENKCKLSIGKEIRQKRRIYGLFQSHIYAKNKV